MQDKSLKEKWWEFHTKNPKVWEMFKKFTFDVIDSGRKNYSVNAIFERIRWHTDIETKGDNFKLSNNHRAYYARHFNELYPEYDDFFRVRELRSEK